MRTCKTRSHGEIVSFAAVKILLVDTARGEELNHTEIENLLHAIEVINLISPKKKPVRLVSLPDELRSTSKERFSLKNEPTYRNIILVLCNMIYAPVGFDTKHRREKNEERNCK